MERKRHSSISVEQFMIRCLAKSLLLMLFDSRSKRSSSKLLSSENWEFGKCRLDGELHVGENWHKRRLPSSSPSPAERFKIERERLIKFDDAISFKVEVAAGLDRD